MITVRPSQVFDFETEERGAEDGHFDPSPLPTLDDRANLYLNAVYGAREFKAEEYAHARRVILDAMTIDAGVGLEEVAEDVPAQDDNSAPPERHLWASPSSYVDFVGASDANSRAAAYSARQLPPGREVKFEVSDRDLACVPDVQPPPVSREPHRNLPRQKARQRPFVLFSAIAASLALVAIAALTLPLVLPNMRTESAGTKIALSADEIKTLLSSGDSPKVVETTSTHRLASSELAGRLFDLGNKLVTGGDLYGGRLILQEAANEGMASAALALGATFDPIEAKAPGQTDRLSDLENARTWYTKAKLLGSTEAQARLDRLENYPP
jgi:hypothetical protein